MLWIYVGTPLYGTLAILVISYVATYIPQGVRLVGNGLMQIDRNLEEASRVNGATDFGTLRRITWPLAKPAVSSAWIMIFIFTVREINTVIVLYAPQSRVLSIMTWDFVQDGRIASAAVVGILQTVLLILGIWSRFGFEDPGSCEWHNSGDIVGIRRHPVPSWTVGASA